MTRTLDPAAGTPEPVRAVRASALDGPAAPFPRAAGGKKSGLADGTARRVSEAGTSPGGRPGERPGTPLVREPEPGRGQETRKPLDGQPRPGQELAPRTYTIALPAGLKLLSLNDRGHWAARYRRSEALKKAAWALALQQGIPRLERVSVVVEYQPGDLRRRDGDNIAASAKALIDGLRAAGVLPEDDSRHVAEVTCRIGSLYPKGRLVLHLTEVSQ